MAMVTGTLADTIKPAEELPPEFAFNPDADLVLEDLWEGYDYGMRNQEKRKLTEAAKKSTCIYKYFIDTADNPGVRSFDDFNAKGYNTLDLNKKDWNDGSFGAKKKTIDELKALVSKTEAQGVYNNPIASGSGELIDPANDTREDFNDDAAIDGESADISFLRDLRKSISEFNDKEKTVGDIVHEKYNKVYQTAERVASGRSLKQFAFIYGQAGIGKSYTVSAAVKKGVEKWKGTGPKPQIVSVHGSIGQSATALTVFFFENRAHKTIIMDDADGFITSTNDDVQNICKCLMDPDGFTLTVPSTIMAGVNRIYKKHMGFDKTQESGVLITVDNSKLNEGIARLNIGGKLYEFNVTPDEANELREKFPMRKVTQKDRDAYKAYREAMNNSNGRLVSLEEQDAFIQGLDLDSIKSDNMAAAVANSRNGEAAYIEDIPEEVPSSFFFTSNIVFVSNLNRDDLDDAIQSRCDCIPIYLTRDEFMFRAEEVLNYIKVSKTTLTEPELVDWAKKESFALFKACMNDLKYKNSRIKMVIGIKLELRIIASLAGLLLARFDAWCEQNGITDYIKPEVFQKFEQEQKVYFIKYDIIPYMAGDIKVDYSAK